MADKENATASLTAENSFCSPVAIKGDFNLSISNTWAGTLTLQRTFDGSNWFDVDTFTANTEKIGKEPMDGILYRVGFKTGSYTSGQADVRLGQ